MSPGGSRNLHDLLRHRFPGLNLYYTDPVQHVIPAGQGLDDLDRDLSDLSVRRAQILARVLHEAEKKKNYVLVACQHLCRMRPCRT